MVNVVIPMAGRGSRFWGSVDPGPKPLIPVIQGKRMVELVIDYLRPYAHRFIFICLEDHQRAFDFAEFFASRTGPYELVLSKNVTRGPAATTLLAADLMNDESELLIAYCDSVLTIDPAKFLRYSRSRRADGALITYPSRSPADSYAQLDTQGRVLRTAEKEVISEHATAGFYYFARGSDYVSAASKLLAAENDAERELFVCPVYNELIRRGKKVVAYAIRRDQQIEMGTPDDLALSRQWLKAKPAEAILRKRPVAAPRRHATGARG